MPDAIPDTNGYMIAGYIAVFIILGGFVIYMALRQRALHAESRELDAFAPDGENEIAR